MSSRATGALGRRAWRWWVRRGRDAARRSDLQASPGRAADEAALYPPFAALVRDVAPGASFADMGCMWRLDGGVAFLAEEVGATSVTAFDAAPASQRFDEEHARRRSKVRFVRGDMHQLRTMVPAVDDPDVVGTGVDAVGPHDVVWCTGVLYHTPSPLLILANLLSITRRTLIVGSKTIPEVPGLPQAAVFFPGLSADQRTLFAPLWGSGITADYDRTPLMEYANWWWGLTPSALRGFVDATPGFHVRETLELPYHDYDDNCLLIVDADDRS